MNLFEALYLVQRAACAAGVVGAALVVAGVAGVVRSRRQSRPVGRQVPVSDEDLLDVGFAAGVVKVGRE